MISDMVIYATLTGMYSSTTTTKELSVSLV